MAWVQGPTASLGGSANTNAKAFTGSTPAGNLVVVQITQLFGGTAPKAITNVRDDIDGAVDYTLAKSQTLGAGPDARVDTYYRVVTSTGTRTVTVTFAGTCDSALAVNEYDTAHTVLNVTNGNTGTTGNITPGSVTPPGTALYVVACVNGNGVTVTPDGAWDQRQEVESAGTCSINTHDKITSGAQNPTTTTGATPGAWVATIATFTSPATAAVTGTATASITEADIVAGGKTIIATLTADTFVPSAGFATVEYVDNALGGTADTTSTTCTLPATAAGDLLIFEFAHRGLGDGTIGGTSVSTDGLTWNLKHSQPFATNTFSGKSYWTIATGDHSGKTVVASSLTNASASVVTHYTGADPTDPLGDATIVGEDNASGNETQAQITTNTDGAMVVLVVVNSPDLAVAGQTCTSPGALAERAERLSTGGTDASISHASAVKATAGATGALTWTQTNAVSGSWAYAIKPKATTPFPDARAAVITGIDSAQSEAGGFDAKVKPNIPVANVVRTSDTVCTITLQAQGDYDITAQETITVTLPASALTSGGAIVATPTFTVDPSGGGATTHATSGALTGPGAAAAGSAARTRAHAATGVLAGPGSAVAGTSAHIAKHATTGALVGAGASVVGAAARTRQHVTSGVLAGAGAGVAGVAARTRQHATSGILAGAGAAVAGAAARTRQHAASGALAGPGASVAGDAARAAGVVSHATSGSLMGQGAVMAGVAARTRQHGTSGVLAGAGAAVAGSAARSAGAVSHATSGSLAGQGAAVAGVAARTRQHAASGILSGPGTTVAGVAARTRQHAASGALVSQGSAITGSAARAAAGPVVHATSGTLVGPGAAITSSASRTGSASAVITGGRRRPRASLPFFEPVIYPVRVPVVHSASGALIGAGSLVDGQSAIGPTGREKRNRKTILMLLT
jgi:hypothetical protein